MNESNAKENKLFLEVLNSKERALRKGSVITTNNGEIIVVNNEQINSLILPGAQAFLGIDLSPMLQNLQHGLPILPDANLSNLSEKPSTR